jgi:nitrite reductase/ring-hydroxylating ferredoxin subunit
MDVRLTVNPNDDGARAEVITDGQRERSIIVLTRGGTVTAYLNSCPHAGVRLDFGSGNFFHRDGHDLQCGVHGDVHEQHVAAEPAEARVRYHLRAQRIALRLEYLQRVI